MYPHLLLFVSLSKTREGGQGGFNPPSPRIFRIKKILKKLIINAFSWALFALNLVLRHLKESLKLKNFPFAALLSVKSSWKLCQQKYSLTSTPFLGKMMQRPCIKYSKKNCLSDDFLQILCVMFANFPYLRSRKSLGNFN